MFPVFNIGTSESFIVDVFDVTGVILTLEGCTAEYEVWLFDGSEQVVAPTAADSIDGMRVACLIEPTLEDWPVGQYKMYVTLSNIPDCDETPRLGPFDFMVDS